MNFFREDGKILILKAHGLGNFLMATPAIREIRNKFPKAEITLYAKEDIVRTVAKHLKNLIDIVVDEPKPPHCYDAVFILNKEIPDIPTIANQYVIKNRLSMSDLCGIGKPHEVDAYLLSLPWITEENIDTIDKSLECGIDINDTLDIYIDEDRPMVAMLPFSVNRPPFKTWNPKKWILLAEGAMLAGLYPIFIGGELGGKYDWEAEAEIIDDWEAEAEIIENSKQGTGGSLLYLSLLNQTTIMQAIHVISQCELAISIDCGLMHVAEAMKIPTVALFGPTWYQKNSPRMFGRVITSICDPCLPETSCKNHQDTRECMDTITTDDVLNTLKKITITR